MNKFGNFLIFHLFFYFSSISLASKKEGELFSSNIILRRDISKIDDYIERMKIHNIKVTKKNFINGKKFILELSSTNWISYLFNNDYEPAFRRSNFPKLDVVSIILDVSQHNLSLNELRSAIKLSRKEKSIVGFLFEEIPHWDQKRNEERKEQYVLKALSYHNALIKGVLEKFHYTFFSEDKQGEEIIKNSVEKSKFLKKVVFTFCGERGLEILKALVNNPFIESVSLNFDQKKIRDEEINYLSSFVIGSTSLSSLELKGSIDNPTMYSLSKVLKKNLPSWKKLNIVFSYDWIERERLSNKAFESFFHALGLNKNLNVLSLDGNCSIPNLQSLNEAIKINTALTTLSLPSKNIRDIGLLAFSEGLKENKYLTQLDLSCNGITDLGLDILLDILNTNKTLKHIWLGEDYFTSGNSCSQWTGAVYDAEDYLSPDDDGHFFNNISSQKRIELCQILQKRQSFNPFSEYFVTSNKLMDHTELDLGTSEDISSSSSSSSAIPDSHMGPDDIP